MTQFKATHTAIGIVAITGAFVTGGALAPLKATIAANCESGWISQVREDVQQAIGGIQEPAPSALDGYYDVRLKKDVQLQRPTEEVQSFQPSTPMPPQAPAPVAAPKAPPLRNPVTREGVPTAPAAQAPIAASTPLNLDSQVDAGIFEVNNPADCVGLPAGMQCRVVGSAPAPAPVRSSQGGENVAL